MEALNLNKPNEVPLNKLILMSEEPFVSSKTRLPLCAAFHEERRIEEQIEQELIHIAVTIYRDTEEGTLIIGNNVSTTQTV